jgi:hypothetical protein
MGSLYEEAFCFASRLDDNFGNISLFQMFERKKLDPDRTKSAVTAIRKK